MLVIQYDYQDTYVVSPSHAISQSAADMPTKSGYGGQIAPGLMLTPDLSALMMTPLQLLDTWKSVPKLKLADYQLDKTKWEQQAVRGSTDYWIHTTGAITASISPNLTLPRNTGLCVEMWPYALSNKDSSYPLFDISFGQYFTLFLHSDGTVDVYDSRYSASLVAAGSPVAPVASGSIAKGGGSICGKYVQLFILPCKRTGLLIWSNLGGNFTATVGSTLDPNAAADESPGSKGLNVITESGGVSMFAYSQPTAANLCFTPLLYSASELTYTSPEYTPRYALPSGESAPAPTFSADCDQEFGTEYSLAYAGGDYNTSDPPQTLGFTVTMNSGAGSVSPSGAAASNALFTAGNLHSPFGYIHNIKLARLLADLAAGMITFTDPLKANLVLSSHRKQKSFSFTIDNPPSDGEWGGLNGTQTSLKDKQNRRIRVLIDTPENQGLDHNDNDPDYGYVAANGGDALVLFDGYTETVEFSDGVASHIDFTCQGWRKKLRACLLNSSVDYDGTAHTDAILAILKDAGFISEDEADDDHPAQIYIYPDTTALPSAGAGKEPLFRPVDGTNAEDFTDLIIRWSGWILDDIGGKWYYAPQDYFIAANLYYDGVPILNTTSTTNSAGFVNQVTPNAVVEQDGVLALTALGGDGVLKQIPDETIANDIWVLGMDDQGNPVAAFYEDNASMSDRTVTNYVGERRLFILVSAAVNSVASAETICAILAANLPYPVVRIPFTLPDLRAELYILSPISITGYGTALIDSIDADLSRSRARTTKYIGRIVATA